MGLPLNTIEYTNHSGGVDNNSSPMKTPVINASDSLNIDYSLLGSASTRNGSVRKNSTQMSGAPRTYALKDFYKENGTNTQVIVAGTTIKHGLTTPVDQVTGLVDTYCDLEEFVTADDEYLIFGNGVDTNLKYNGTWQNLSIQQPSNPSVADAGAGSLSAGDYAYYVSFARTVSGIIVQESEPNPVAATITIAASHDIDVTIPTSTDAQVNARVIYRLSPTSIGVYYRLVTIFDNTTTVYTDSLTDDQSTIEPKFDNQAVPNSPIFDSCFNRMFYVDGTRKTDLRYSPKGQPFYTPAENLIVLDSEITCVKLVYNVLIIGTKRSLWIQPIDPEEGDIRRISSKIGILNNRCCDGNEHIYFVGTDKRVYALSPTDFSQSEIRLDKPISDKVDYYFKNIPSSGVDDVALYYQTRNDVSKVHVAIPFGSTTNSYLLNLNETATIENSSPCWEIWNNLNISAMGRFDYKGVPWLHSGDYNGFLWRLDDPSMQGDGAEVNGTATSATSNTLTDTTKSWTVGQFDGMSVTIVAGSGVGKTYIVESTAANTITIQGTAAPALGVDSEYSIGSYKTRHFSAWLSVLDSFNLMKQLWFIWASFNASGDYNITAIIQTDFNVSETDQQTFLINLSSFNAIWWQFLWGSVPWGSYALFYDKFRHFLRFNSIRIGFQHNISGQPWIMNMFGFSVQNKGLFFRSS